MLVLLIEMKMGQIETNTLANMMVLEPSGMVRLTRKWYQDGMFLYFYAS